MTAHPQVVLLSGSNTVFAKRSTRRLCNGHLHTVKQRFGIRARHTTNWLQYPAHTPKRVVGPDSPILEPRQGCAECSACGPGARGV